jgi:two-component system, NtrC family, response regulator HydG
MHNILIIDDEMSVCQLLTGFLNKNGFKTVSTTSGKQGLKLLQENSYDLILCDYRLNDLDGKVLYDKIRKISQEAVVIFITGYVNLRVAIDLIKEGVYQYLEKPLRPDDLLDTIKSAMQGKKTLKSNSKNGITPTSNQDLVLGDSRATKSLIKSVNLVGPTDYSVVIEGETGTGKESIAKLLHQQSNRNSGPFIPIDCGSLSKEIAGSELFGHEKGAFTGAFSDKVGAFELAEGGTVFLDEIGNLSMDIQIMLLRAIQERVIRKIGSVKVKNINVRIIAATNENLLDKVATGSFREDLFYRINEFNINVPPLRERRNDLALMVDRFLQNTSEELGKESPKLEGEVEKMFNEYPWPGNIRELKNTIRRACLLTPEGETISTQALPMTILNNEVLNNQGFETGFQNKKEAFNINQRRDLKSTAHMAEANHIQRILREAGHNKTKAAKMLNIDRKTLYQKLKRFELVS